MVQLEAKNLYWSQMMADWIKAIKNFVCKSNVKIKHSANFNSKFQVETENNTKVRSNRSSKENQVAKLDVILLDN